jgi:tetratricopeptide (TPR) repeat protein
MRIARGLLLSGALLLLVLPEFSRYSAEHALRGGSGALRVVVAKPEQVADPAAALNRIAEVAETAASGLPGDPRPRILSGSARLVSGDPARALEEYRAAYRMGERAETDLNVARAYEALGKVEDARAAYLRAAWISPTLLSLLLPDVAAPIAAEVARLEGELKAGRLKAPPPLP